MNTLRVCYLSTIIIIVITLFAGQTQAEVPATITYQGRLLDDTGQPLTDTTVDLTFELFETEVEGESLWSETHTSVPVTDGVYSVTLGTENTTLGALAFDQPYYLQITVGTSPFTPRQPLTSVPYAQRAAQIEGITIENGWVGIGTSSPISTLDVAGPLRLPGNSTLLFTGTEASGTPVYDAFRIRGDSEYFGTNCDAILFEKTDGNDANPDGGLAFVNTGNDGVTEPALVIRGNGHVGVGTIDPEYPLEVAGTIKLGSSLKFDETSTSGKVIMGGSANAGMALYPNTTAWDSQAWVQMWNYDESSARSGELDLAGSYITFRYGVTTAGWGTVGMTLASTGNVGIGTTTPEYTLDVNGTIRAGDWVSTSDVRLKEDIRPLDQALERLQRMRGVTFHWKDQARSTSPQIGLIAQEVEAIFPEVVSTDSEGYKSIAYDKLVAPLIEAVKTLKVENEWLNANNKVLRAKQAELERRLNALEAALETQQK